jgi:hypothetical protein
MIGAPTKCSRASYSEFQVKNFMLHHAEERFDAPLHFAALSQILPLYVQRRVRLAAAFGSRKPWLPLHSAPEKPKINYVEKNRHYILEKPSSENAAGSQIAPLNNAAGSQIAPLNNAAGSQIAPLNNAAGSKIAPLNYAAGSQIAPLYKA